MMMHDIKSAWESFDRLTESIRSAIAGCEERSKVRGYLMNAVWEHFAIYRSLPNLQSEKELIRAFEGVERILIELLHSLGGRHSLWVYRYTVPRSITSRSAALRWGEQVRREIEAGRLPPQSKGGRVKGVGAKGVIW